MKKRTIALFLCTALCVILLGGCAKTEKQPEIPETPELTPEASSENFEQEITEKDMEHMLPILEGIALAAESGKEYAPQDPNLFWHMMYYVAYNNGAQGEEAVLQDDGSLTVSQALIERYAAACFEQFQNLPEVPSDFDMISYDAAEKTYMLKASDKGEVYGKVYTAQEMAKGIYRVSLNLFAGDDALPYEQYEFTLVDNKQSEEGAIPNFAYSVREAKKFEMNPGNMAR